MSDDPAAIDAVFWGLINTATASGSAGRPCWTRVLDYLLGGDELHPPDLTVIQRLEWAQQAGCVDADRLLTATAYAASQFRDRAMWHVAAAVGQVLVLGTDLPRDGVTPVHQIVQLHTGQAKVAYLTDDELVWGHMRMWQAGHHTDRSCSHLHLPLDDPAAIVRAAASVLDLTVPIAVLLPHLERYDNTQARQLLAGLADGLAAGSHLILAGMTPVRDGEQLRLIAELVAPLPMVLRTPPELSRLAADCGWRPAPCRRWPLTPDGQFWPLTPDETPDGGPLDWLNVCGGIAVLGQRQCASCKAAQAADVPTTTARPVRPAPHDQAPPEVLP